MSTNYETFIKIAKSSPLPFEPCRFKLDVRDGKVGFRDLVSGVSFYTDDLGDKTVAENPLAVLRAIYLDMEFKYQLGFNSKDDFGYYLSSRKALAETCEMIPNRDADFVFGKDYMGEIGRVSIETIPGTYSTNVGFEGKISVNETFIINQEAEYGALSTYIGLMVQAKVSNFLHTLHGKEISNRYVYRPYPAANGMVLVIHDLFNNDAIVSYVDTRLSGNPITDERSLALLAIATISIGYQVTNSGPIPIDLISALWGVVDSSDEVLELDYKVVLKNLLGNQMASAEFSVDYTLSDFESTVIPVSMSDLNIIDRVDLSGESPFVAQLDTLSEVKTLADDLGITQFMPPQGDFDGEQLTGDGVTGSHGVFSKPLRNNEVAIALPDGWMFSIVNNAPTMETIKAYHNDRLVLETTFRVLGSSLNQELMRIWFGIALLLPSPELHYLSEEDAVGLMDGIKAYLCRVGGIPEDIFNPASPPFVIEHTEYFMDAVAGIIRPQFDPNTSTVAFEYEFVDSKPAGGLVKSVSFTITGGNDRPMTLKQAYNSRIVELSKVFGFTREQVAIKGMLDDNEINLYSIACIDENAGLGKNNELLFDLPGDLKAFKDITSNNPIIMGSSTAESIGRVLPNRLNIIVSSRDKSELDMKFKDTDDVVVVPDLVSAIGAITSFDEKYSKEDGTYDAYVIGGASIYEQLLPYCKGVVLTCVKAKREADTFFPPLNSTEWDGRITHTATENDLEYSVCVYERKLSM